MTIKEIKKALNNGQYVVFGKKSMNVRYPCYSAYIVKSGVFYAWQHYGSSANRQSELSWLLKTIFKEYNYRTDTKAVNSIFDD
jgi:hypothetical protein